MIKAIQTRYAGYLFRSRLEARWAVFFDALKLNWLYEPEGFDLPSGKYYLPDFKIQLRGRTLWIEVKPGEEQSGPLEEFIKWAPEEYAGIVLNEIPDPRYVASNHGMFYPGKKSDRPYMMFGGGETGEAGWDNFYQFCICESCKEVGFQFDGRSARIGCGCAIHTDSDKNYTSDNPAIVGAFAKARGARFEHGAREKYVTV